MGVKFNPGVKGGSMPWTPVRDGLPEDGAECLLICIQTDGSIVEMIGYRQDGRWVIEGDESPARDWHVQSWMPLAPAAKII